MTIGGGNHRPPGANTGRIIVVIITLIALCTSSAAGLFYNTAISSSANIIGLDDPAADLAPKPRIYKEAPGTSTISLTYFFERPYFINMGYDHMVMEGMLDLEEEGEPVLPFKSAKMLIPPGAEVLKVDTKTGEKINLPGEHKIVPAGKPMPLSEMTPADYDPMNLVPDEAVYESNDPYPGKFVELVTTETYRGYDIAVINLFPVQYIPASGEVHYYSSLMLTVTYRLKNEERETMYERLAGQNTFRDLPVDSAEVTGLIDNPSSLSFYDASGPYEFQPLSSPLNASAVWDMVIITSDAMNETAAGKYSFADLATYRNNHGVKTVIVTVENITANPDYWNTTNSVFNDTQAQIRNFIIYAYKSWGITYVLLGGDGDGKDVGGESGDNIIPGRGLYCAGDKIPADLYYSGLDGNWNNDGDSNWGEYPTETDLFGEVYVGRAPVDSLQEIHFFVNKTLHYETTNHSYLEKTLMVGEYLWPNTYAGDYMDELVEGASTHGYTTGSIPQDIFTVDYNISTLYDRDWPVTKRWPKSELIKVINEDLHVLHHLGHSNTLYNMRLSVSDVAKFNNTEFFLGYSQGCYPAAFDNRGTSSTKYYTTDSIVEHFVLDEFGAFAFIANSRYGYGMQGSTNGASQRYHRQFVDALHTEDMLDIGRANQDSKHDNIAYVGGNVNRWCYYEINLFGDPSLMLRPPKPPAHDISVPVLEAPSHVAPSTLIDINATILNRGFSNESSILVSFKVDGVEESNFTIPALNAGEDTPVSFNWTPVLGMYNVSVETVPVAGEIVLVNNMRYRHVIVEPDVAVPTAVFEDPIWLSEQTTVVARVENIGQTTVTDLKVIMSVDGSEVNNQTVTTLSGGSGTNVDLDWTPQAAGDHVVSIFAVNQTNEHSISDNYYNKTLTVKVRPELDWNPTSFDLTVAQGKNKTASMKVYNNGTSGLYYDIADFSTKGQHRKIALISDKQELDNLVDTLNELGFDHTIYSNNSINKYTEKFNILEQYELIIFYSASRGISLTEKLTLDRYVTEHGGNLIVSGYDSLGSPTDNNMAYVTRSQRAGDGPWWYECNVADPTHPIINGPFGKLGSGATFFAANFDHDRAMPDPDRGSKAIATVEGYSKILVSDSIGPKNAKIVYWNGNRYTLDWDDKGSECEMLLKNMLVWAADDGRADPLTEAPDGGLVNINNYATITLTADASDLDAGTYYRNIAIASNDTDEPSVLIPISITVPVPDHDVTVFGMTGPASLAVNKAGYFNATLKNEGSTTEKNIKVELKLDGVPVALMTVGQLNPSATSSLSFLYSPNSSVTEGMHQFSIEAQAVAYENGTFNNAESIDVDVFTEAILEYSPDTVNLRGRYDEVVKTNITFTNSGSGVLDLAFGTYNFAVEDKFTSTTIDSSLWTTSGSPVVKTWALSEPSTPYSINLDSKADILESKNFDLSNATYAEVGFYLELGGIVYRPRSSAWLHLEYNASNGTWQPAWEKQGYGSYAGYGIGNITFEYFVVKLPADAFHSGFKFRFRTSGVANGYDDWFIDDIRFEYLAFDDWLYAGTVSSTVPPYSSDQNVEIIGNLTSLSPGVYYNDLYIKSNDVARPMEQVPVEAIVLGDLDHIHMSQSVWLGTTDEILTLTGTGHDLNDHEVGFNRFWSTTDPNGTVVNGVYDPGRTGTWTVYCNNSDNSISNYTMVTISTGNLDRIVVTPGTWSGAADSLVSFNAKGYDEDNNQMAFSAKWTTTDPLGSVTTQTGWYTAGKVGSWIVSCTKTGSGIVGTATVTVNSPASLFKIEISPATHTMTADDTADFTATLLDKYNNIISTTPAWSVNGGGTIDAAGKYTANTVGTWTISATAGAVVGTAKVIVNAGVLDSIVVEPSECELTAGDTQLFQAVGYDADGNVQAVTVDWSVTGGGSISSSGMYHGKEIGDWTVTATSTSTTHSATAAVTISAGPLTRIEITPGTATVAAGETLELTGTGYDAFGNIIILDDVSWSVPADAGKFITPGTFKAEKIGSWTVTFTDSDSGMEALATITITPGELVRLEVSPGQITVFAGEDVQYSARGYDSYDNRVTDLTISWSVTYGSTINSKTGLLSAEKLGLGWITATAGKIEGEAEITVRADELAELIITPGECSMNAGETEQFSAEGFDAYGNKLSAAAMVVSYSTSGGGSIGNNGLYAADTAGAWVVTARCGDISTTADVTIAPSSITKLVIDPSRHTMFIGEQVQFTSKAYDLQENEYGSGDYSVVWSATDGAGSINSDGLFTAEGVGTWTVTATYKGGATPVSTSSSVTVKPNADTDSDGDGMPDVWELDHGLNPQDELDADTDTESDGASNLEEYQAGTNPNEPDTDGDSLPDGWELDHDLDPTDATGVNGDTGDPDGDRHDNLAEYGMASDPQNKLDPGPQDPTGTVDTGADEKEAKSYALPIVAAIIIVCVIVVLVFFFMKKKMPQEFPLINDTLYS